MHARLPRLGGQQLGQISWARQKMGSEKRSPCKAGEGDRAVVAQQALRELQGTVGEQWLSPAHTKEMLPHLLGCAGKPPHSHSGASI